jgi:hypothetical protein
MYMVAKVETQAQSSTLFVAFSLYDACTTLFVVFSLYNFHQCMMYIYSLVQYSSNNSFQLYCADLG